MARNEFKKRMEAIGAVIEVDDVTNMYATLPGSDPQAKRIVMASHCDSVKNAGKYIANFLRKIPVTGVVEAIGTVKVRLAFILERELVWKWFLMDNRTSSIFPLYLFLFLC